MEKKEIREVLEKNGIDGHVADLPVVDSILKKYCDGKSMAELNLIIRGLGKNKVLIAGIIIKQEEDGTLKLQAENSTSYFRTDKTGMEIEKIIEVTHEGERKLVRRGGIIREVFVDDQGERYTSEEIFLDNGHPHLNFAMGAKVRDKSGEPVYFNGDEALRTFDENMTFLRNGSKEQQTYYMESRRMLEATIQDEKISRLPPKERVRVLKEIKDDLEREYNDLCSLIELELDDHRNNLYLVQSIMKSKKIRESLGGELDEYKKKIVKYRISPNDYGEIFPRVLPYVFNDDSKKTEDERLQKEEDALVEKIYAYRKRNVELRARLDMTSEMADAIKTVYSKASNPFAEKNFLFRIALDKFERERERILKEKVAKRDDIKARNASVKKNRKDKREKEEFERRRQKQKEVTKKVAPVVKTDTVPVDEKKTKSDDDDDRGRRSIYTPAGKM